MSVFASQLRRVSGVLLFLSAEPNRRFKFKKRRQFFIRVHNQTFSIIAVRIDNKDRLPLTIHG